MADFTNHSTDLTEDIAGRSDNRIHMTLARYEDKALMDELEATASRGLL